MAERMIVEADLEAVRALLGAGAAEMKYCYQCSTCTVVCPVTPEGSPFPRKEMIQAQWGLLDRLLNSLDSWLCFNCNDCTTHCPRGARPGDLMSALRTLSVRRFSRPSLLVKAAHTPALVWLLFLLPLLLFGAVIAGLHGDSGFGFLEGPIIFSKMLPVPVIDAIFLAAAGFAVVTAALGLKGFIGAMRAAHPRTAEGRPLSAAVLGAVKDILFHGKFIACGTDKSRAGAHLLTMYGFIGLAATTTLVGIFYYLDKFGLDFPVTPYQFMHPIKILGNVSGLMVLSGCLMLLLRRLSGGGGGKGGAGGGATAFDWIFLWVLILTVVSGFLAQFLRVSQIAAGAYLVYYLHLVLVFFLLAYAPHTKFAHIFYRTAALIYARYCGRNSLPPGTAPVK